VARPLLIVGGAPQVEVDAVRYLVARASGGTAAALTSRLADLTPDLLLGAACLPGVPARRYLTREELDRCIREWVTAHGEGVVVLSAAVNDYRVAGVRRRVGEVWHEHEPDDKVPSGADELQIRLLPAPKLVDAMRNEWGHRGPLVAFKFEQAGTVVASARALMARVRADLVVANSLCGRLQALLRRDNTVDRYDDRDALMVALAEAVRGLAFSG